MERASSLTLKERVENAQALARSLATEDSVTAAATATARAFGAAARADAAYVLLVDDEGRHRTADDGPRGRRGDRARDGSGGGGRADDERDRPAARRLVLDRLARRSGHPSSRRARRSGRGRDEARRRGARRHERPRPR